MGTPRRIALIDIARTSALCAMVIFHFTYDLEMFGFAPRGTMASREWVVFAWVIAGSFIFLSGVSLVLAVQDGPIQPRKYIKRLAMLGLAALAVTAGTYVSMGNAFVRFGILHLMFAASILGLLVLRRPFWLTGLLGGAILAIPYATNWPFLGSANWLWLGKSTQLPPMVDYAPLIPWLGIFLLGMAAAQLAARLGLWGEVAGSIDADTRWAKIASWPGQHSLAIYLIHQPVLFGSVYAARLVSG
ncbi:heparan-alpha-glucosaminide N-acetyltransferase [Planktotalea sp.]|uniref:heparan-alpha-glucosaminide N-acetyltransferase n=1 Tax=Planktotalea sp. TaxID=2029877 RepID=UPI0025CC3194|nr:heparan-alpha-glucosaminide N-acetyltransferase [Planktotalea sp.]